MGADGKEVDTKVTPKNVYQAIALVQAALAKVGIGKDKKNEQQNYKFRGIDDVYNALAPLLAENGLCVMPRVLSRHVNERVTMKSDGNGGKRESVLFYVVIDVEYDFVLAAEPTSRHTIRVCGEAMDSGDKATNKAMSAAYKYACLQTFCIPTEGDNDADGTTHGEIAPKAASVFESADLREMFVKNWLSSIEKAGSTTTLKDLKALDLAKLNAMKGSANEDDVSAFTRIVAEFNPKFTSLKQKEVAEKNKTVDALVKSDPLKDDEIPF